jgi:fatty-acyl-CoA synthase
MRNDVRTLADALEAAATADTVRGLTFVGSDLSARRLGYDELAARSRAAASALLAAGLGAGDRVFLVLPTGEDFLLAFFGSCLVGIAPCPLAPPQAAQPPSVFAARLAELVKRLDMRAVLVPPELAAGARGALPPEVLVLTPDSWAALGVAGAAGGGGPPTSRAPGPEDIAFLQLTSGSTSLPRGVLIPHAAVVANLRQIQQASGIVPGDVMVSWLPLFHDMGLVGALLLALGNQMELVLSNPWNFLRRPAHWVQAIGRFGGTHSLAPTFAYRQLLDRLTDRDLEGVDLSSWRVGYVGAEPVHADVLAAFERRLSPYGLSATTLLPCYGMAEATLAITFKPFAERYRTRLVSRKALSRERRAVPPEPSEQQGAGADDELLLVSCGKPLAGTVVTIRGEDGETLGEGHLGEIAISGPSLFAGYAEDRGAGTAGGGFHTGDLGFLDRGELFITGRKKELIILSGENHHPAEIEWAADGVAGIRSGRVAAFGVADREIGTERLCLLAEVERRPRGGTGVQDAGDPDQLAIALRRQVREKTGVVVAEVELVPAGTIPVTTSGKLRRARAREIFLEMRSPVSRS